ncbi:MAG: carboxyltransferase domain-containing protein [Cucumibacter sp.]
MADTKAPLPRARLVPLGDQGVLVRFAEQLTDAANRAAIAFARALDKEPPPGAVESASNLVSVLVRYDPAATDYATLAGELRLRLGSFDPGGNPPSTRHDIAVDYGGEFGPDLAEICESLGKNARDFVGFHTASPVRVLATGFAPGFVYLGLHADDWTVPRRREVREAVPAGSVLFAAAQTAIAATTIRSGWHVIGKTDFGNFDAARVPPTILTPGDLVRFRERKP